MRLPTLCALAFALAASDCGAQFAAFVAPARFELAAKPGQKLQEVLELGNDEAGEIELRLRTADWTLRPDGGVDFQPDYLAPDSCRPWVRIERHVVKVAPKGRRRFRFEVDVPPDAGSRLCRFALLVEPAVPDTKVSPLGGILLPIQGRIGVIVYVRIGGAKPELALERVAIQMVNGRPTPVVVLRNSGNAHGRAEGILSGNDATGRAFDFVVAPLPVLPGETRAIPAWPQEAADGRKDAPKPPIRVKGTIEWDGGRIPVDAMLEAPT